VLAYVAGASRFARELVWFDRQGSHQSAVGEPGDYGSLALSPDGRSGAVVITGKDGKSHIWTIDVTRGVGSRQTSGDQVGQP
jgi:Tol biopolymer transport system component